MAWRFTDDRPIWLQLTELLTLKIVSGEYAPQSQMPSVRALASEAGVNPNTMQRALAELETKGLVETRRTAGRTVTEDMQLISETRKTIALERINEFMKSMNAMGYTKNDVTNLLNQWEQEENK